MSVSTLNVPNSNTVLYEGIMVVLERFPETRWIVHNGGYRYNGIQSTGWYFSSIPTNTIIPVTDQDLVNISVVADDVPPLGPPLFDHCGSIAPPSTFPPDYWYPIPPEDDSDNPPPQPLPPIPPVPTPDKPAMYTEFKDDQLMAAFISVPTAEYLDKWASSEIPDGKIVRVNDINGEPVYLIWDKTNERWNVFDDFGADFTVPEGSGLKLENDELSIDNDIEAKPDGILSDINLDFGQSVTVPSIGYTDKGLISGLFEATVTMPELSGEVGQEDNSKIVTYAAIDNSGVLSGQTLDVADSYPSEDDSSIPNMKALKEAINTAEVYWRYE